MRIILKLFAKLFLILVVIIFTIGIVDATLNGGLIGKIVYVVYNTGRCYIEHPPQWCWLYSIILQKMVFFSP